MRLDGTSSRPGAQQFRIVSAAMIAGVVAFGLVAAFVARGQPRPSQVTPAVAWVLAAAAVVALALSWLFEGEAWPRRIVAQALREAIGLIGALITLLTGEPAWVAGLGALAVVALAAGMLRGSAAEPPPGAAGAPSRSPRPTEPR